MQVGRFDIDGIDAVITRSGYTGEDGFEISFPPKPPCPLPNDLLLMIGQPCRAWRARHAAAGSRASAWGHELDETINPVTAGLGFALSKRRRAAPTFLAPAILEDHAAGPARRLVGLLPQGGRPVRDGAEIRHEGRTVGHVSSGGFSPTLDAPAALGFVDSQLAEAGTQLDAIVRDRPVPLVVSNLPLVPHRYIRG